MAQPMPPPPPPKSGFSSFTLILFLALVVVGVAAWRGWFTWGKNPEGKMEVTGHVDKFKADKDAFLKKTGEAYAKLKDKITGKEAAAKTAKPEDKKTLETELDDLKKQRDAIDAAIKKAEAATDEAGLKLEDSVKKLLDNPK